MTDAYAAAGVDVEAGERAVALMRESIARASRPEVMGGFGGFAGLFDASALRNYQRPLLVTATDGVGTKVAIAAALGRYDTIGQDLVAMVLDDIVVTGATPLFMTDYIACGRVVPERIAAIVSGIADGCQLAGAALVGGETAEHPGLLAPDEFDVAGAGTGVVESDELRGPQRVAAGDVVIAMASSGLHSNGYSLARNVLLEGAGWSLTDRIEPLDRTLGEELLEPTRIYALDCLALIDGLGDAAHAFSHITGGGIAANIARVLPADRTAVIDRATWTPGPIFPLIAEQGQITRADMERTFNMGMGMVAVVAAASADDALALLAARGQKAWIAGEVRRREAGEAGDAHGKGGQGGAAMVVGDHQ